MALNGLNGDYSAKRRLDVFFGLLLSLDCARACFFGGLFAVTVWNSILV